MSYSVHVYVLASAYGKDAGLTDGEIAKLAQFMQTEMEEEIENLLFYRKMVGA
jgi:hypothetical protein